MGGWRAVEEEPKVLETEVKLWRDEKAEEALIYLDNPAYVTILYSI